MTKALTVHGVDLSHHNPDPDFVKFKKAGGQFCYHKATEGTSFKDSDYEKRRAAAKKAKVPFGAYHFARPEVGDAEAEAKFFLSVANPKIGDLIPALDLETTEGLSNSQLETWAQTFSKVVKKETGFWPVIYTPFIFSRKKVPGVRWVPRYNNDNRPPAQTDVDIWQFSNGQLGVPNAFAGVGKVDLNTFMRETNLSSILMKKVKPPVNEADYMTLDIIEVSMQFSDKPAQMEADAKAIFARAKKRGVHAVMGTEAGAGADPLANLLNKYAKEAGYKFWMNPRGDAWYAIQKDFIDGDWDTWSGPIVIPGKAGRNAAKLPTSVSFVNNDIGPVSFMAAHYMTKGRPNPKSPEYGQFTKENKALATAIGERAVILGRGKGLVFYAGDQNIVDRTDDTFFGQPMTSAWDELGKWDNTGHGNIDVIASYDKDGRVVAVYARALDDQEFPLHTDHFMIEAGFRVKLLKK